MGSGAVIRMDEAKRALRHDTARFDVRAPQPAARAGQSDAAQSRLPRHRIHLGELIVELRNIGRDMAGEILVPRGRAVMLVAVSGTIELSAGGQAVICPAGMPFLYTGADKLGAAWRAGTTGLLVFLRCDRLNAAISAILADGRRIGSVATCLPSGDATQRLEHAAERILRLAGNGTASQDAVALALESALYEALAERISGRADLAEIAPAVRAVSDAMRIVRADHRQPFDVERLAARVGVTGQTLRKGFRLSLGMTVKEYVRSVRLAWAYERLDGARESRSLSDMAVAAGFTNAPAFSRAYLSRYGEVPSQTRARAAQRQT